MKRSQFLASGTALALLSATPGWAQDDMIDPADNEIIVTAESIRGQIDVPQAPVAIYDEAEIASFGAGSIAELMDQIAPQTGSGRGRGGGHPAFLVNGQRISSFREMRNYPPEAVRRIEVLPEEVALRFGFRPDQRVVNMILKDNYASITGEIEYGFPSAGGYAANEQDVSVLRISGKNRFNIGLEVEDASMLTEADRGVSSVTEARFQGDADQAVYRSLLPDTRDIQLTGSWTRGLGKDGLGGSLSLNGSVTQLDSLSLRGIDAATLTDPDGNSAYRTLDDPARGLGVRTRDTRTRTVELGGGYDAVLADWRINATADWTHEETRTTTVGSADTSALRDAVADGSIAYDAPVADLLDSGLVSAGQVYRAYSNTENASALVTLTGQPAQLPAGELALVLKAGFNWDDIDSFDTRNPGIRTRLTRGDADAGFTLGVPLASRRTGAWEAIGDLSLDLSGGVSHLSDFGTLFDGSAGLTWGVTRNLDLSASYIVREAAPSLTQLGAPQVLTSGATVYDFSSGQTVQVDLISGGNPDLVAERQTDWKFALNWDLPVLRRSRLIAEYYDETSRNVSASFPVLTPAIEAAFPDRVIRDDGGNLVSIDQRPVTFSRQEGRRLRYGIDLSDSFGAAKKVSEDRSGEQGRTPRMPGMGRGMDGGRWSATLYHTIRFQQDVLIGEGGPVLDLLSGDALTGSATPRHEIELQGGAFKNGIGLRVSGKYLGGSRIDGNGASGTGSLDFHPYATFDARLFVDLERQFDKAAFLKGSRISLRVDNIFDAQQRVTDGNGLVPVSYQPDFQDPKGRFFEIDFRKRF